MNSFQNIIFLSVIIFFPGLRAKSQGFVVSKAPFSSALNDEFSPVFYKGGIVFCSNLRDNSPVLYKDENKKLFKIFFVPGSDTTGWGRSVLFSKELTTGFNDGPATFSQDGNIIYYSRNNSTANTLRNTDDASNKLGLYSAEFSGGSWRNIRPFRYNDPRYSFSTPSLAPDGGRLYFSSDMPGGFGGMDIYYCDRQGNDWAPPLNMGPVINTSRNESFPFASKYNKLYFSSDGHGGMGGKDLYYTQEVNGLWIAPVQLDSSINSPFDDFGIVIDTTFENGYFSSHRQKTDDIFRFTSAPFVFEQCDTVRKNKYCFTFSDDRHSLIDSIPTTYRWNFGDGIEKYGPEVKHCFSGPGKYSIRLIITDNFTGDTISEKLTRDLDIENFEQIYIISPDTALVNKPVYLTMRNDLHNFNPTDFLWDFGEGFIPGSPSMEMTFEKKGAFYIKAGFVGKKDSSGKAQTKCYIKKIRILDTKKYKK